MAREGLLLEMAMTRLTDSQEIYKPWSEFPVIYLNTQLLPLAYSSLDGATWQALTLNGTNDVRNWSFGPNVGGSGKAVMLWTAELSACVALYSNKTTGFGVSHRAGASNELSGMTIVADPSASITDFSRYWGRRVLAVGTPGTVTSVINQAVSVVSNWGDL